MAAWRYGFLVLLAVVGSTPPTLADGTRDCPNQLAGVGSAHFAAAPPRTCSVATAPRPQQLVATLVESPVSAANCGRCLKVSGPAGSVDVLVVGVVEASAGHNPGDLILSSAAAAALSNTKAPAAPIAVSWLSTSCANEPSITLDVSRPKGSPKGLDVVVRGHRTGLASVNLVLAGRNVTLDRLPNNHFATDRAVGDGPWVVSMTDVHGRPLRATVNRLGEGQSTNLQFPACSEVFSDGFEGGDLSAWGRPSP